MTAKEYLAELGKMRRCIESLNIKLQETYNDAAGVKAITYDKDRIQTSPVNKMEELMIKVREISDNIVKEISRYQIESKKRIDMINQLNNPIHSTVLIKRYVDDLTWEQIAVDIHYTYRHVTRLHGEALQSFTDKYKDVLLCPNDV